MAITDIRLQTSLRNNVKVKKLLHRLGGDGLVSLIWLWLYAAENAPEGVLEGLDGEEIEIAAGWSGEAGRFVATLENLELLEREDGQYSIHDWEEHQPWAVGGRKRSMKAKAAAAAKWSNDGNSKKRHERLKEARAKGTHTQEQWDLLRERLGNRCVRCGADGKEVELVKDHIVPIYLGGSDAIDNLQPLCRSCNSQKGPEQKDWRKEADPQLACLEAAKRLPNTNLTPAENARTSAPSPTPTPSPKKESSLRSDSSPELPLAASGDQPSPVDSHKAAKDTTRDGGQKRPPSPVVLSVPLIKRDGEYEITQADVHKWQETFPAVDVMAELRVLLDWNINHPKNRKTRAGFRAHVSRWLGKAQNQAPRADRGRMPQRQAGGQSAVWDRQL